MDVTVDVEDHGERKFHIRFGEKFSFSVPHFIIVNDKKEEQTFTFVVRRIDKDLFLTWEDSEDVEPDSYGDYCGNEARRRIGSDDLFEFQINQQVVEFRMEASDSHSDDLGVDTQDELSTSDESELDNLSEEDK